MTKWGIFVVVIAFVVTIFADWGAKMTGWSGVPPALEVDGEEISFDQLDRIENSRMEDKGELSDSDRAKLYASIIDDLIREKLSLREAKRVGFTATANEIVNQTRDRLFRNEQGQLDLDRFKRARREVPSAEWLQYEKMIENDITLWKIYNLVAAGLVFTQDELRDYFNLRYQRATLRHILVRPGDFVSNEKALAFYDAHPDSFMVAERVKGRHILFPISPNADPAAKLLVRSKAEETLIRLQSGLSFDRAYSDFLKDTSGAVIAQDLDWFGRGQMVPEFDTVAFNWPVRTVTRIIETQFGYHIAYFDAHELKHRQSFDDVREGVKASLAGESEVAEAKRLINDIAARIKNGEPFADLAAKYSSGKSAARGGLVGDVIPGEMSSDLYPDSATLRMVGLEMGSLGAQGKVYVDPEINRQIFDLEVGKISEVVTSGHGFHLVKLERRRPADPRVWETQQETVDKEYREFLKNQIYQDWIQTLKLTANIHISDYVKRRLE